MFIKLIQCTTTKPVQYTLYHIWAVCRGDGTKLLARASDVM